MDDFTSQIKWEFRWDDYRHLVETTGRHRGIEFKAAVPGAFASRIGGPTSNNFPPGSRPYVDNLFSDGSGRTNFGFGAADASYFQTGVTYFAMITVVRTARITSTYPMQVATTAMTREDHDLTGCSYQVSLCTFPDYSHSVIRGRDLMVGNFNYEKQWIGNSLYNQSFEEGYPGFPGYAVQPGKNRSVYCYGGGYKSNCFLEFNKGSGSFASIYQDVNRPAQASDNYTAEAMVRCSPNQPDCSIRLAYWGLGGTSQEVRYQEFQLAANNRWYLCRVDLEHGGGSFQFAHDRLRWELYNLNNSNLDVDYTTLAMPVQRITGTRGDPSPPPTPLPACTIADIFDN